MWRRRKGSKTRHLPYVGAVDICEKNGFAVCRRSLVAEWEICLMAWHLAERRKLLFIVWAYFLWIGTTASFAITNLRALRPESGQGDYCERGQVNCDGTCCASGQGCCDGVCYDLDTQGCCNGHIYDKRTEGCCADTVIYELGKEPCCDSCI